MEDLLLMIAGTLSHDDLIKQLKDSITKYESDPTDDNLKGIQVSCMILLAKQKVEADGGIEKSIKATAELKEALNVGERITGTGKNKTN